MSAAPCLSPAALGSLPVYGAAPHLADAAAAGWPRDVARSLREWASLPRTDTPSLAWLMCLTDRLRFLCALTATFRASLPEDAWSSVLALVPDEVNAPGREARAAAGAVLALQAARPDLDIKAVILDAWEQA